MGKCIEIRRKVKQPWDYLRRMIRANNMGRFKVNFQGRPPPYHAQKILMLDAMKRGNLDLMAWLNTHGVALPPMRCDPLKLQRKLREKRLLKEQQVEAE